MTKEREQELTNQVTGWCSKHFPDVKDNALNAILKQQACDLFFRFLNDKNSKAPDDCDDEETYRKYTEEYIFVWEQFQGEAALALAYRNQKPILNNTRSNTMEQLLDRAVGVTFDGCQEVIKTLKKGDRLDLIPEFDNPYDSKAIRIEFQGKKCGYVKKGGLLQQMISEGTDPYCEVYQITGGCNGLNYGLTMKILS